MATERRILKTGPRRTVWVEWSTGTPRRVIKRFHAPGILDRLRDGHRARREVHALHRLARLGFPVPRNARARRVQGHWQLETDAIEGGRSLDQILDGGHPWPVPAGQVARNLASLLARMHRRRLVHTDPHPGNVVIDARGQAWLVDAAQVRRSWGPRPLRRLLVILAASVRETANRGFRLRFLHQLEAQLGRILIPRSDYEAFERQARARRRAHVQRQLDRWTRESGVVTAVRPIPDRPGWRLRRLPPGPWRRLRPNDAAAGLRIWTELARWREHHIPGPRPILLRLGSRPRLVITAWDEGDGERDWHWKDRGLSDRHPPLE